jgi:hypothetical protein
MKPGVIFVLFALATFLSVAYAAPASSEIQQDDDSDSEMTDKGLVEVLKQIVSQAKVGDEQLAQAEFFKSLFKNTNWGGILRNIGGLASGLRKNANQRRSYYPARQPHYRSYYSRHGHYESAKNQGEKEVMRTQQIDAELQAWLNEILKYLTATKEKDEEVDVDDDNKVQTQREIMEELEDLLEAKEQRDEEDRDALAVAMKADDSADLDGPQDDEDDDDEYDDDQDEDDNEGDIEAELQRIKRRKRRRHRIRNRPGGRRGHRYRGSRRGGRRHGNGGRGRSRQGRTTRRRRSSWLSGLRRFPWNNILSGVGGFLGNFSTPSQPSGFRQKNKLKLQQIDDDYDNTDDNDVAQSEALNELENVLAAAQEDDNDTELQAQSEVLKELMKILIAANQQ